MSELATKQAPADDAGTFVARICFSMGRRMGTLT